MTLTVATTRPLFPLHLGQRIPTLGLSQWELLNCGAISKEGGCFGRELCLPSYTIQMLCQRRFLSQLPPSLVLPAMTQADSLAGRLPHCSAIASAISEIVPRKVRP